MLRGCAIPLVTPVFVISGNHDSAERIAFGSSLMKTAGVYLSPVYNGESAPVKVGDEFGSVNVYMLPFIRPSAMESSPFLPMFAMVTVFSSLTSEKLYLSGVPQ